MTGLYYYGYRWYDAVTGRWASRDLIGEEGGIGLYLFLENAALDSIDLVGLQQAIGQQEDHHWFPRNGDDMYAQMEGKCKLVKIDRFTTTYTAGTRDGRGAHNWIHRTYNRLANRLIDQSKDCCEMLLVVLELMAQYNTAVAHQQRLGNVYNLTEVTAGPPPLHPWRAGGDTSGEYMALIAQYCKCKDPTEYVNKMKIEIQRTISETVAEVFAAMVAEPKWEQGRSVDYKALHKAEKNLPPGYGIAITPAGRPRVVPVPEVPIPVPSTSPGRPSPGIQTSPSRPLPVRVPMPLGR